MRQRAVFLFRTLKTNIGLAREIAEQKAGEFELFFEDQNDETRDRLFWEFNSLSVVYKKPSERFLKDIVLKQAIATEKKYFPERVKKIRVNEQDVGEADEID